jgi:DNA polymerase II small subunit
LIGRVGTRKERELAGRVKYLIIAGDIVDGIGIYPGQERELAITSITKQYSIFAKYLEKIPEYIEVIIIPGNHDATRQALPQPAILRKYADVVYRSRRLYMLGNPAVVELDRMRFLLYHGRSLEDIIGSVRGMDYKHPEEAMRFLLDVRHVGPVYGKATPISPENQDWLVIEEEPDIFHAGHIHVNGYTIHRGVRIVNSGTWQLMTEYQRRLGISPTPGKVPVLDMRTLEVFELNFMSSSLLS